jgi:hypothetical protein
MFISNLTISDNLNPFNLSFNTSLENISSLFYSFFRPSVQSLFPIFIITSPLHIFHNDNNIFSIKYK